jgi:hypothetical protein
LHTLNFVDMASTRGAVGALDIGAYELGSPVSSGNGGSSGPSGTTGSGPGSSGSYDDGEGGSNRVTGSCDCRLSPAAGEPSGGRSAAGSIALAVAALSAAAARRRRRPRNEGVRRSDPTRS